MLTKSLLFLHITIKILRPQEVVYKEKVSKKQKQRAAKFTVRIFFSLHFWFLLLSSCRDPSPSLVSCRTPMTISCLICCDLMFSLALHFHSLRSRSPYLPGNVSPDCLGNSPLPACNESGQRLEQLNRRDNQSLIQTAMQNIQAIPSENVLSGILDFKLHLINLKRARRKSLMDSDRLKRNMWSPKPVSFPGEKRRRKEKKKRMPNIYSRHIHTRERRALCDGGFYFMHLSVTSILSAAEVCEQPLLIKISEQSHACRCLPCFCQKTSPRQIAA